MVDVGSEYEAADPSVTFYSLMELTEGPFLNLTHTGRWVESHYFDMTNRTDHDPGAAITMEGLLSDRYGLYDRTVIYPPVGPCASPDSFNLMERTLTRISGRRYDGKTYLIDGMFNSRDKLARIGVVVTVSGVPLGNTDVILNGLNHREIIQTDHRGIWWKYLEVDEYPDALFVSPNGITYDLLKQAEREDNEGIFDQMAKRRTIANATSRQLHRKFV